MISSNHVIEVSEADFDYEVIQYSRTKPVVVDFWAEWCIPCNTLGPLLTELVENADGRFRLAKVDVDENPNLAIRYKVIQEQPQSPAALLGLSKCLLAQNKLREAQGILKNFPASKEYVSAEILRPLAEAMVHTQPHSGKPDLEAIYLRGLNLIKHGKFPAALDGLLELLRQDKTYRGGNARKIVLAILEMMGEENEITRQYRAELASVLF